LIIFKQKKIYLNNYLNNYIKIILLFIKMTVVKIINEVLEFINVFDKVKIFLYVTWLWAYLGLYFVKFLEFGFKLILLIPNNLLTPINSIINNVKTTDNKEVQIITAINDKGQDVKNKLKLFLTCYYTKATSATTHETNGFNFKKFAELVSTSILECQILLFDDEYKFDLEKIIEYFITFDNTINTTTLKKNGEQLNTFLHHVSFDEFISDDSDLSDFE